MAQCHIFFQAVVLGALCVAGPVALAETYTTPTYNAGPTYTTPTYTTPTYTNSTSYPGFSVPTSSGSCVKLSQNLYSGLSDITTSGAVSQLQRFLTTQGYFTRSITGYFGPVTLKATQAFQASQGISALGYAGSLTRAAIQHVSCGTSSPAASPKLQDLLPASGHIGGDILITGSGFLADNAIYFDDYPLARVASRDATTLSFVVPLSLSGTQVKVGQHSVFVQNANGTSNTLSFMVTTTNSVTQHSTIQNIDTPGPLYPGQTASWIVHISIPTNYTNGSYLSARWGDENLTAGSAYSNSQSVDGTTVTLTHLYSFAGNYQVSFTLSDASGRVLTSEILTATVR